MPRVVVIVFYITKKKKIWTMNDVEVILTRYASKLKMILLHCGYCIYKNIHSFRQYMRLNCKKKTIGWTFVKLGQIIFCYFSSSISYKGQKPLNQFVSTYCCFWQRLFRWRSVLKLLHVEQYSHNISVNSIKSCSVDERAGE